MAEPHPPSLTLEHAVTAPNASPPPLPEPYDPLTRAFHWATAVLVLVLYGLYVLWEQMPKGTWRHLLIVLHMSLGIALTAVLLGRIAWRLSPPSTPQPHRTGFEGWASRGVHALLYLLLIGQVLLGWNFRWAQGQALSFFGLPIDSPFTYPAEARHVLGLAHYWTGTAIMALAGLHAAAALAHHYVLHDATLRRMTGRLGPSLARETILRRQA